MMGIRDYFHSGTVGLRFRMLIFTALFVSTLLAGSSTAFAAACPGGDFLGFTKWYAYLNCNVSANPDSATGGQIYTPVLSSLNDIWLVVAAVIEMLLRIAALAAVGLVIWGGIQYITSQGEPDKTKKARGTILNAVIGLVIAVISAATVAFIAGSFK
jgi:Type IV secretion system pilin